MLLERDQKGAPEAATALRRIELERGCQLLHTLPSAPQVLLAALEATRGDLDFDRIAEVVAIDPVLCAQVLDVFAAQTPPGRRLVPMGRILTQLGADAVRLLVASTALRQAAAFGFVPVDGEIIACWLHALRCAHLARLIARKCAYPFSSEAHIAGLLHVIGRLAFRVRVGRDPAAVPAQPLAPTDQARVERAMFGASAGEVAEQLVRTWHLQSFLGDALLYHAAPPQKLAGAHALVRAVHLAHVASAPRAPLPYELAAALFGLGRDELEGLRREADEAVAATLGMLGLPAVPDDPERLEAAWGAGVRALVPAAGDLALLMRLRPNLSGHAGVPEAVSAMRRTIHILCGHAAPLFFLYESARDELRGIALPEQNPLVGQLALPCEDSESILVQALRQRRIVAGGNGTAGEGAGIIDAQIVRLCERGAILCVPLVSRREAMGVMVLGMDEVELGRRERHERVLETFGEQAGQALEVLHARLRRERAGEPSPALIPRATLRQFAHEINNPLAIVKNYVKILRIRLGAEDPSQYGLEVINDEIDRAARMVRTLADVPAAPDASIEVTDVNRTILDLIGITTEPFLRGLGARLVTGLDHTLPKLRCDRSRFKQVLLNLVRNAAEAVSPSGTVWVETRANVVRDGKEGVEIVVRDDGPGIPDDVRAHLFQPVVSNKGPTHAGLGLAIVHTLLLEMGGSIACEQGDEGGTVFRIHLPAT